MVVTNRLLDWNEDFHVGIKSVLPTTPAKRITYFALKPIALTAKGA